MFTKANKLREKVGAEPGAFNPLPYSKPKGMHQKTTLRMAKQQGFVTITDILTAGYEFEQTVFNRVFSDFCQSYLQLRVSLL